MNNAIEYQSFCIIFSWSDNIVQDGQQDGQFNCLLLKKTGLAHNNCKWLINCVVSWFYLWEIVSLSDN